MQAIANGLPRGPESSVDGVEPFFVGRSFRDFQQTFHVLSGRSKFLFAIGNDRKNFAPVPPRIGQPAIGFRCRVSQHVIAEAMAGRVSDERLLILLQKAIGGDFVDRSLKFQQIFLVVTLAGRVRRQVHSL